MTEEEKAMWVWWREMEKRDPQFQWKALIEFYGTVVDQANRAVAGARIRYSWTTVDPVPDPSGITTSGSDGLFAITGLQGKRLVIDVSKDGFAPLRASRGSFDYGAFHEELFHVPDPASPVVFRLHRLHGGGKMYKHECDVRLGRTETAILDVEAGQFAPSGDFTITPISQEGKGGNVGGWGMRLEASSAAGMAITNDELMFEAPIEGYVETLDIFPGPDASQGAGSVRGRLYVRTRRGAYAAVVLELSYWQRRDEFTLNAIVLLSADGSRNLEFYGRNWINR